ncbi:unnamed protein product [Candida verbasci]|uniref:CFEM domain-containing protein n=1 Tax=Candida verbasci TaxID=1227364 RepID=A0A9W4XEU5_9ASCO|nr:unnamed protein product [Candida verbasci]
MKFILFAAVAAATATSNLVSRADSNVFIDQTYDLMPSCAQPCVQQSTNQTYCASDAPNCYCFMLSVVDSVGDCIAENCSGQDVTSASSVATNYCTSKGLQWWISSDTQNRLDAAAQEPASSSSSESSSSETSSSETSEPTAESTTESSSTESSPTPNSTTQATTPTGNVFIDQTYDLMPSCAQPCVQQSTNQTYCASDAPNCYCFMLSVVDSVGDCIASSCTGQDVSSATSVANDYCTSKGLQWWISTETNNRLLAAEAGQESLSLEPTSAESSSTAESSTLESSSTPESLDSTTSTASPESSITPESSVESTTAPDSSSAAPESTLNSNAPNAPESTFESTTSESSIQSIAPESSLSESSPISNSRIQSIAPQSSEIPSFSSQFNDESLSSVSNNPVSTLISSTTSSNYSSSNTTPAEAQITSLVVVQESCESVQSTVYEQISKVITVIESCESEISSVKSVYTTATETVVIQSCQSQLSSLSSIESNANKTLNSYVLELSSVVKVQTTAANQQISLAQEIKSTHTGEEKSVESDISKASQNIQQAVAAQSSLAEIVKSQPTSTPQVLELANKASSTIIFIDDQEAEEFELQTLNELDYEVTEEVEETGNSNMKMAFMNMANSILGAGIIGQPYAFRNSGLIGGIIVMILLTILIDWTLRLIVKNSILSQTKSYQDTVNHCFGLSGKIVLLISICSFAYGGCMAFCVIIGDTIPHVLKVFIPETISNNKVIGWLFYRNTIIVLFTTCISYPLSLNRDISKLAKASGFALIGMLIIVVITIFRAPFVAKELRSPLTVQQWTVNIDIFQGISVISFALVCHHNTMFIYQSMKNATMSKFAKLTHISCFVSMVCCMIMGINGLVNFGDITKGNILNNFKSNDGWINLARFCFGLNMLTTFPLEIFVVRDVLKEIILVRKATGGSIADLELSSKQHFFITTILVFSSMSVSLFTCNLGLILELIGATSASLMAYIIPPLCYFKLSFNETNLTMPKDKKRFWIFKGIPNNL